MNVVHLISQHPMLNADLQRLGLPNTRLRALAENITAQLGGDQDQNLYDVLAQLSSREFVLQVDTRNLAKAVDVSPVLAQSAIYMIAPWVGQFRGTSVH
ncbi:MAG: hypothetical protein AAF513_17260 [Pseudomonadota bacterium]